jgi:hypothetical protein
MSQFSAELDLLKSDCLSILVKSSTVTLTKRTKGAFNTSTGRHSVTTTTSNINAIPGDENIQTLGQERRVTKVYTIDASYDVSNDDLQNWTITDGGVKWVPIAVRKVCQGRMLEILCGRTQ